MISFYKHSSTLALLGTDLKSEMYHSFVMKIKRHDLTSMKILKYIEDSLKPYKFYSITKTTNLLTLNTIYYASKVQCRGTQEPTKARRGSEVLCQCQSRWRNYPKGNR
ncbi:hypothetical protein CCAN11_2110023 [Capnocytophaga canimorsus]|uniref:Uncharacterized protein n=1 Tax=Capnocytophaga canimorsus TaxID=28188 RepID=A0A0B7IEE3_9FLAO|nr:hypothetical protein CCAN11_2110023 [Capnocytophaga canimorsus]